MHVIYTRHALAQMVKRQLSHEWVARVIAEPARVEDDEVDRELEHRLGPVPELANRVLRVIVTKSNPVRVVTAHLDRQMKGKI